MDRAFRAQPAVKGWTASSDAVRYWRFRSGMLPDRAAILSAAWDKEQDHMSQHWRLKGVRKGILYVTAQSPAAAMELQVRSREIIRGLNKYFKTAWIKGIKACGR